MQAGPYRLVSLMTAESVEELGLRPGTEVVASVKATNLVVGLPG
jgi:molybdopterin-binding protein